MYSATSTLSYVQDKSHCTSHHISPLPNHPPSNPPDQGVAQADVPGLRPVQVRVRGLLADEAEGVEGVVDGPFALEGVHRPIPDEGVRVLGADGGELALEVLLADFEGGFELDVVR